MNIVQFWIIDTIVKAKAAFSSPQSTPRDEAEVPFLDGSQAEDDEETRRNSEDLETGVEPRKDMRTTDTKLTIKDNIVS